MKKKRLKTDIINFNFENYLSIDKNKLDEELERQASLYIRWTKEFLSEIEEEYGKAKINLDITQAEVDKEIRNDPSDFGIKKVSEAAVKNAIELDGRVVEAKNRILQKKKELTIVQGALRSLDHKKTALENLVRLTTMGYFSTEPISNLSKKIAEEYDSSKIKSSLNKKMKRRIK